MNYEIQNKEAEASSYLREMSRLRVLHGLKPQDQIKYLEQDKTKIMSGFRSVKKSSTIDLSSTNHIRASTEFKSE